MRTSTSVACVLSAAAALALLAGCSGGSQTVPASQPASNTMSVTQSVNGHVLQRSFSVLMPSVQRQLVFGTSHDTMLALPSKKKKKSTDVYVSSSSNSTIYCFDVTDKKGKPEKPTATITAGISEPQGLAATKKTKNAGADLLVANTGAQNVLQFSGECGAKLVRSLSDASGFPADVAAGSDGTIYVTNIIDLSGAGEVRKYVTGDNVGTKIGDPNLMEPYFLDVDKSNQICVDGFTTAGSGEVDCSTDGGTTWTNTGIPVTFPGGVAFDAAGNLVINDQQGSITEYSGSGSSWSPVNVVACPGTGCVDVSFAQKGKHLLTAASTAGYEVDWPLGTLDVTLSSGTGDISAQAVPGT